MKAAQIDRFGGPEVFTIVDLPAPEIGPRQLLVRVAACGVNFAETKLRQNKFYPITLPIILGSEVAGVVEAVGSEVHEFAVGDRVAAPMFADATRSGGYAELAVGHADTAVRLPDSLSFDDAVAAMAQGLTALYLVKTIPPAGKRVLITSAAGGVGSWLVQLCLEAGAKTIVGAVSSDTKFQAVLDLGADAAVNYRTDEWVDAVRERFDGHGPDIVFEGAGGAVIPECLNILAEFGKFALYSSRTMDDLAIGSAEATSLNFKNQSIVGFSLAGFSSPEHVRNGLSELYELLSQGRVRTIIGGRYSLGKVGDAHRALESRDTIGKILLAIGEA
nr:zinc-binding dehydrogenase [Sphingomonas sp. Y57]